MSEFDIELTSPETGREMLVARNIGEHLEKKYPGWLWGVTLQDGVVAIKCMRLSGNWGFILHEDKMDNDYKCVTNAAGELLERYNMSRKKFKEDEYMIGKKDFRGFHVGDYS